MGVLIHCEPRIGWQGPFAAKMAQGLAAIGIPVQTTASRARESDIAILLGTTCWRQVEATGRYLLVDRCSFGDTNQWVTLVWDGHGRRGDFKARCSAERWEDIGVPTLPWKGGSRVVLCGQTEPYSPHYGSLGEWYARVQAETDVTHFRAHPAGDNPTGLPTTDTLDDCRKVITLNSSIGVGAVLAGVPTVTMDEAAMAWDVTSHRPDITTTACRDEWCHWLAWTQWHHDEIEEGLPIKHLFEEL